MPVYCLTAYHLSNCGINPVVELHAPAQGGGEQARVGLAWPPGAWRAAHMGVVHILGAWHTACGGMAPSTGGEPRWHPTRALLWAVSSPHTPLTLPVNLRHESILVFDSSI